MYQGLAGCIKKPISSVGGVCKDNFFEGYIKDAVDVPYYKSVARPRSLLLMGHKQHSSTKSAQF